MNIQIKNPFDAHLHLRDPDFFFEKLNLPGSKEIPNNFNAQRYFEEILNQTIYQWGEATVMPNAPAINDAVDLLQYRELIEAGNKTGLKFNPLMTLKIGPKTSPQTVIDAFKAGAIAGKLYPDGVTTASTGGVQDFDALSPVFKTMEDYGMILCIHGEMPKSKNEQVNEFGIKPFNQDGDDNIFTREYRFHQVYRKIRRDFPNLKIILEHITDHRSVKLVADDFDAGYKTAATITLHHLLYDIDSVLAWPGGHGEGINPHFYCKPIEKFPVDRDALISAALSGMPCFFFGSDSAPHYIHTKECECGCAGVFSAPVLLPMLTYFFETNTSINKMQAFVSDFGRSFYNLPKEGNGRIIELKKEEWTVPMEIGGVHPMLAGKSIPWKVI